MPKIEIGRVVITRALLRRGGAEGSRAKVRNGKRQNGNDRSRRYNEREKERDQVIITSVSGMYCLKILSIN